MTRRNKVIKKQNNRKIKKQIKRKKRKKRKYKKATILKAVREQCWLKVFENRSNKNVILIGVIMILLYLIFMWDMINQRVKEVL